jgi:predicted Zn-ribbon and HTH transcriptional regulator
MPSDDDDYHAAAFARRGTLAPMSPTKRVRVTAFECTCARCGRKVTALEVPARCPSCKSHNWLEPARWKKPTKGRRPKKG